jgi:hypothetical protein
MIKILRKPIMIMVCFTAVLILNSCASLGPQFQKVETFPNDKGLVYIYRPSSFIGSGVSYDVKVGETPVTTLHNGGYYPYFSEPGEVEFRAKTESKSSVTLDIKPGQIYYIKGTVGVGFVVGRPHLMIVESNIAENEITKCKLIPEKKEE